MEPGDSPKIKKVKLAPPVPIKTYQWEDIRRAKKRGKYPYTYLYKGPYLESATMDEQKISKPSTGEKKVKKVKKVKKIIKNEDSPQKSSKEDITMEVEQLVTEETEITEIKLKDQPERPDKIEIDEISSNNKTETDTTEDNLTIITEFRDLSAEKTDIVQEDIETILPDSNKLIPTDESQKHEPKENVDKMSVDMSIEIVSKSESRNTESEDTYTESNIEQYLDKEEISKSVSDTSCLEATTSMSDVELPTDTKRTLEVQADKKRKHSDLSEVTKSNLSLFEKMKNSKFKAPTFKIPKFKKLTFSKKNSKRIKTEPSQKTIGNIEIKMQQRRDSEPPVYIYIPLNPTPEELEQERQVKQHLESSRRPNQGTSESSNGNNHTNGTTTTPATPKTVSAKIVSSKWKSLQSKAEKKSPTIKKKSTKTDKKISPKLEKKTPEPVSEKDDPVEYIFIPLHPPDSESEKPLEESKDESNIGGYKSSQSSLKDTTNDAKTEIKTESKESPKGAVRKTHVVKSKKSKDSQYKLAKDIKKLAAKLRGIKRKNKKVISSKKSSTKSSPVEQQKTFKKASLQNKARGDSPVEYIHIPLKGPLPNDLEITEVITEEIDNSEKIKQSETENEKTKLENGDDTLMSETTDDINKEQILEEMEKQKLETTEIVQQETTNKEEEIEKQKTEAIETVKQKATTKEEKIEKQKPEITETVQEETTNKEEEIEKQKSEIIEAIQQEATNKEEIEKQKPETTETVQQEATNKEEEIKDSKIENNEESLNLKTDTENKEQTELQEKSENIETSNEEKVENSTPRSPSPSVHPIESILRMASSSTSLETQKYIKNPPKDEKKESLLTRLKSIKHKQPERKVSQDKKSIPTEKEKPKSPKTEKFEPEMYPGMRHKDSIVEYIHISLKPEESETNEEQKMTDIDKSVKEKELLANENDYPIEDVVKESKETDHSNVEEMTENESLVTEKTQTKEGIKNEELDTNKERSTEKQPVELEQIKMEVEVVEETNEHQVPLNTSEILKTNENISTDKNLDQTNKPTIKQSVVSKWKGLKVGLKSDKRSPPSKKKPTKKVSPKSEKKPVDRKKNISPVAMRREDSIVEYIHIPLNPTEEELAAEKEKNIKLEEGKSLTNISTTQTPEPVQKQTEIRDKSTSKGAIKKVPQDKNKKLTSTSSKLAEDIKKFASKLKDLQKKSKKPTFKTFKRSSKHGSKKLSPTTSKKPISTESKKSQPIIQPRRSDSPVEYIFIPLNPTPEQLRLEQEREKLRMMSKKPTEEEIKKEKEKQKLRRLRKLPPAQLESAIKETTRETKPSKVKVDKSKKQLDTPKKQEASSSSLSTFNTLKKTKEFSKNKLKTIKDSVKQTKEKISEKKSKQSDINEPKKLEEKRINILPEESKISPQYIFIPLKGPENEIEDEERKEIVDKEIVPSNILKEISEPEKVEINEEAHHYERISKEDEEDGLKTPILLSTKESKILPEEETIKSVLKVADSPKLNKKVSFTAKKPSEETENGLNTIDNVDDNVIYETIQIKGEPDMEQSMEKPSRRKKIEHQSVEELPNSSDRDDQHEKWSKSTDHEYEPINPPPEPEAIAAEFSPPVHATQLTDLSKESRSQLEVVTAPAPVSAAEDQGTKQPETRLLRIPLDTELVVTSTETSTPSQSTPKTQHRTEGFSTNLVDQFVPESAPPKKESKTKQVAEMEQPEPQGPNLQEKLKTQAGKLKTKFKGIKKPTFTIPNPKFKKPHFEKPKFQRPKFEAPKFSMPAMPKMPDRSKINFPTFKISRPGNVRRQRSAEEQHFSTTQSSGETKRNIFDFRTYPRIFDRSKKKHSTTDPGAEEPTPASEFATVPRAAARKKGPVGARWVHRFTDIQFVDDDSKKPASYTDELNSKDRGDSLERRMEADLRYEQALAEADEEMREYERENQNIHRRSPYHADGIEFSERWRHGSFRGRNNLKNEMQNGDDMEEINLDQPQNHSAMDYDMQQNNHDEHSSLASSGHRGVIEEIDSDQFFLREKGISQDNIQVGLYLSSEIRDAFRQPVNALTQMEREYDLDASDLSLPRPSRPKRKHMKKTKRIKKTPHASHENISFDRDSVNTEPEEFNRDYQTFPLPKPRRNKRSKILAKEESLEMSQSEIPFDDDVSLNTENLKSQDLPTVSSDSLPNIIGYVEKDVNLNEEYDKYINDELLMYENEVMKNIEQPEIIINANQKYEIETKNVDRFLEHTGMVATPKPPTRRHKSLKSLNLSEHDSIMGEFNRDKMIQDILEQELNIYRAEHEYVEPVDEEKPVAPRRTRSRSRNEDDRELNEPQEIPCQQEFRDAMGYAIVNKSQKYREPPLPSTPRRRRSTKSNRSDKSPVDTKFFTVPRSLNDTPPVRPIRNYSTLGPNRPPRKRSEQDLTAEEEKENIDISQYIEIEDDDHSRDLQSGEVINKMKGRPLPAPPRPPRKSRDRSKETLRDITQQSNIISDDVSDQDKTLDISLASQMEAVEEIEVSTQTDPLPDDFCCEEFVEEPTDIIVAPTRRKRSIHRGSSINSLERSKTPLERDSSIPRFYDRPKTPLERASSPNAMVIESQIHSPVEDETITHASLIVKPVPEYPSDSFVSKRFGADFPNILQDATLPSSILSRSTHDQISSELEIDQSIIKPEIKSVGDDTTTFLLQRDELPEKATNITEPQQIVWPVQQESERIDEERITEVPEKPQRRKSQVQISTTEKQEIQQPQIIERIIEKQIPFCVTPGPDTEVEILKAQRLQVNELDVEKLNVSELQANKILVSEIDGMSLQISELTSKSGNLVVNGLEIPSGLIQEILDRLQPQSSQQPSPNMEQVATQTSIEEPEPNTKEFTEPATEQVATQTSIEIAEDETDPKYLSTEHTATQTSIDEPEDILISEEELIELPPIHADYVSELEEITESIVPQESVRLPSPTIIVDPPEPLTEEPEPDEEQDAIDHIRERIRFIEEEMNEFISDFTPDEVNEIKSEIDSIIDIASEHARRSTENIAQESENLTAREIIDDSPETECPPLLLHDNVIDEYIQLTPAPIITRTTLQSDTQVTKPDIDSVIPKEFHELKSEQEKIMENIQNERKKDVKQNESSQSTSSPPTTPPRPPLPEQEHVQGQIFHEIHYPLSYYPEYVHSLPPTSFYTLRSHPPDLSEEEIPVHHRRRRHPRHLSRSSSEEDRRAVSRRHTARSPEPTIPQLSGQLVRACSNSAVRVIRQLASHVVNYLETREGKHNLQIALVILLILITGLILLGIGSGKTIHLHHWEYFNPPREL